MSGGHDIRTNVVGGTIFVRMSGGHDIRTNVGGHDIRTNVGGHDIRTNVGGHDIHTNVWGHDIRTNVGGHDTRTNVGRADQCISTPADSHRPHEEQGEPTDVSLFQPTAIGPTKSRPSRPMYLYSSRQPSAPRR